MSTAGSGGGRHPAPIRSPAPHGGEAPGSGREGIRRHGAMPGPGAAHGASPGVSGSSGYLNSGVRVLFLASGNNDGMAGVTTELARILIVDDKADIRNLLATRLRLEPAFEVVGEAANGAEAIARIGELKPHLMILDLQMPVMSGEEVIPIVRSLAPWLRVVVFSAYSGTRGRLTGSERPDAEVRKGSGLQPLITELRRLLVEPPRDLIQLSLGPLEVEAGVRAADAWTGRHPYVRQMAADGGWTGEFLALMGVFLALGQALRDVVVTDRGPRYLRFETRLDAARAARRALAALGGETARSLEPLRGLLLRVLP
jgi:CheY-like chemotaxis protein